MNNGYINIEIDGQKVGLKFGMVALPIISEKVGVKEKGENYGIKDCAHILYAGYLNNCEAKDSDPIHDFSFFYDYCESAVMKNDLQTIIEATNCLANSQYVKAMHEASLKAEKEAEEAALASGKPVEKKSRNPSTGRKLKASATVS